MKLLPGLLAGLLAVPCFGAALSPREIVRRSVAMMERNWTHAPEYSFREHDVETSGDSRTTKTQQVLMIDGSPYYRLISRNGRPLSAQEQAEEERKLRQEAARRQGESAEARARRIAQYKEERRQNQALLREMAEAFNYRMAGERMVEGRRVWVLEASPRAGYHPKSFQTRVLKGMRGTMWIDQRQFQWVKVEAEVFRPVAFGLFIAKVQPGTKFELRQAPVTEDVWLPSHFSMRVDSSILWWDRRSTDDETYSNYQPMNETTAAGPARRPAVN